MTPRTTRSGLIITIPKITHSARTKRVSNITAHIAPKMQTHVSHSKKSNWVKIENHIKENKKIPKILKLMLEHKVEILRLINLKKRAEENIKLIEELFRRNKIGIEYYTSHLNPGVFYVYLYLGPNYAKRYFYKTTFGFNIGFDGGIDREEFIEFMDSIREFLPKYKAKEFEKGIRNPHLYFYTTLCLLNGFYFAYFVQGYIMSKAYLAGAIYAEKEDMTDNSNKIRNFNLMLCYYPKDFTSLAYKETRSNDTPYIGIKSAFNDAINSNKHHNMKEFEKSDRDRTMAQDEVSSIGDSVQSDFGSYSDSSFHPDSVGSYSDSSSDGSSLQSVSGSSVATEISLHDPGKLAVLSDTVDLMNINLPRMTTKVNIKFDLDDIDSKKDKINIQEHGLNRGGWVFDIPTPGFHIPLGYNVLGLVSIPIEEDHAAVPGDLTLEDMEDMEDNPN